VSTVTKIVPFGSGGRIAETARRTLSIAAEGLNALEAQFCGTPVLAPDAPPFTETMVDGASGFLYTDPRLDGGRHFGEILDAILAGRPRPDPRVAAKNHLDKFTHAALVERARAMIKALSDLK